MEQASDGGRIASTHRHVVFTIDEGLWDVFLAHRQLLKVRNHSDPHSVFHFYKRLIALRKQNPIMIYGSFRSVLDDHEQIYAYFRELENERWLVLLNFSADRVDFGLSEEELGGELCGKQDESVDN